MTWQSIETAPMDGTFVLLHSPKPYWDYDASDLAPEYHHTWSGFYCRDNRQFIPTFFEFADGYGPPEFWMPLPEPPPC